MMGVWAIFRDLFWFAIVKRDREREKERNEQIRSMLMSQWILIDVFRGDEPDDWEWVSTLEISRKIDLSQEIKRALRYRQFNQRLFHIDKRSLTKTKEQSLTLDWLTYWLKRKTSMAMFIDLAKKNSMIDRYWKTSLGKFGKRDIRIDQICKQSVRGNLSCCKRQITCRLTFNYRARDVKENRYSKSKNIANILPRTKSHIWT